jgi:hypothetical protein
MFQLGYSPTSKEDGLREFKRRGWILVDATYEPVNTLIGHRRDGCDRSRLPSSARRSFDTERWVDPDHSSEVEHLPVAGVEIERRRLQCRQQRSRRLLSQYRQAKRLPATV